MTTGDSRASFGFRDVDAGEKAGLVRGVFDSVASRYDLMNDLMSGGVHRLWKAAFIARANPQPGMRLVDVAGGTGDIAAGFLAQADERMSRNGGRASAPASAILCDINFNMLEAGLRRKDAERFSGRITRVCGDAQSLPLPDNCADIYTIAFGIRNVTDRAAALAEARRVLKPGGRFLCLEFSHPITGGLQKLYDAYSFSVIPWLGEIVADDRESYQYLVESIRRFPTQDQFVQEISKAGLSRASYHNLTAGLVAIHSGWRI